MQPDNMMTRWGCNKILWWHDEDATRYYDDMMRMQQDIWYDEATRYYDDMMKMQQDIMMTWWGCNKILWWHDEDATR